MKRHVVLWGLILVAGLAASMCRAEVKPLGTEIPRANGPVAKSDPHSPGGDPVSCVGQLRGWFFYRPPIRGSFCRGSKFGVQENHPPLYAYFPPANGCALPPPAPQHLASAQPPEQAPMPRPLKGNIQQTSATTLLPTVPKPKHVLEGLSRKR